MYIPNVLGAVFCDTVISAILLTTSEIQHNYI